MQTLGVADLKARLSQHLERVKAGEEIVITERGQPIARIVPLAGAQSHDARILELARRGTAVLPERKLTSAVLREILELPRPRLPEGAIERALDQEREERF